MDRREALRRVSMLLAGAAVAPDVLAAALADPATALRNVPADRIAVLAELADTIIPDTDCPGAKVAKTEEFIALAVEKCLPVGQRKRFWDDLTAAEEACMRENGKSFTLCTAEERFVFLKNLEREATKNSGDPDKPPFFQTLKTLTLYGYFSSEIGATQALNYDAVPGVWVADMKIDETTKAWASMF